MLEKLSELTDWIIEKGRELEKEVWGDGGWKVVEEKVLPLLPPSLQALPSSFEERFKFPYTRELDLPLLDIRQVFLILFCYLSLLWVLRRVMERREKFELRFFGALHNLFLTLLSLFMFLEILHQAVSLGYSFAGNTGLMIPQEKGMTKILWIFYISKIPEMGDTVIMMLKKNFHQVSFLHVYHHVSIFIIWWFIIYGYPCGDSYFSAAQNSFVHVLMYSYYFLSLFKISVPWKVYLTYLQMFQFMMNILQASYYLFVLKKEPALPMQILLTYCFSLLLLFANYLFQSQKKNKLKGENKPENRNTKPKSKKLD